jgi:hypothetical protein
LDTVLALTAPLARRIAAAFRTWEGPSMARNVVAACLAALVLAALSGCGTVMNLTEEKSPTEGMSTSSKPRSPYGGVGYDFDMGQ